MPDAPFVHLHCHTHYSLLDGANRIPELVSHVKEQGMNAVAMTDHGNLYGAVEFYQEAKAAGVNPIIGYEAYVAPGRRSDRETKRRGEAGFHLTILAQNLTGFKNLIKLSSIAFLEGFHYVPRIDKELLEAHREGLIILSGCASSEFSEAILKEQMAEAKQLAGWFARVFGKNFYVEIQNNGLDIQRRCAEGATDIANELGLPLVATSDAHYLKAGDDIAHDVLLCINTGRVRDDPNRMKYGSNQFYVRPPSEMYSLFPDQQEAVKRTQEIADAVDIQIDFKKRHFPVFAPPAKKKPEEYLRELCHTGLEHRYPKTHERRQEAAQRLEHELDVICRMGFASYFLIVWDFVRFAREKGIAASARGSACGAIVSYVLQLTHVCPLEYDLLFERFLDPNRSEAPDIDIDFCQERREEVITYVKQKYGEQSVAQIGTFGTLAARAAIKDVGRALNVPFERVNQLTNLVPKVLNISLDESLVQAPDLKKEYDSDPQVKELIDIARKLEGTNRNAGTHAAGVVIANGPLTDYVPLQRVVRKGETGEDRGAKTEDRGSAAKDGEVAITTQWVMGDLEAVGMLKMDFLGLRTLTLLDNAVQLIAKTRGEKIDLQKLSENPTDAKTYELLQRGDAKGVFQLESDGIRELLKRMKPDCIRDLIATNALYRPGPLGGGMVDAYVNRKHGREKPQYPHAVMEEILGETHGVMVYQEQVMRILNRLGGIELSSAYACIKAISKKKHEIIDQRRAEFLQGAQKNGVSETVAREIFDLITFFGGYGFNKSHSAAYALLGYQTAYLKAHYPAEFMAALLSSEIEDGNKRDILVEHIGYARKMGLTMLPPDINAPVPNVEFGVHDGKIVFGLTAIKGLGRQAAQEIVRAREAGGAFKDIFDFCERIDHRLVPRAGIERLIKAGAFDGFAAKRRQLFEIMNGAMQAAAELQQDRKRGQKSFFATEAMADEPTAAALPNLPEWSSTDKLRFEKEALDFYFSSHPLAQHEEELRRFSTHTLNQLVNLAPNQEVVVGGMMGLIRFQNTKKARNGNSRYARCKFEDLTGAVECVMWPDDFVRFKDEFVPDRPCFVRGTVERTRDEPGLVLTRVMSIDQAKRELARSLWLMLNLGEHGPDTLERVRGILQKARGSCPVQLGVTDLTGKVSYLRAGEEFRVNPATIAVAELEEVLGTGRVKFAGPNAGKNGR